MTHLTTEFSVAMDAKKLAAFYKAQFTARGLFLANPWGDKTGERFQVKPSERDGLSPEDLDVEIVRKGPQSSLVRLRQWKQP